MRMLISIICLTTALALTAQEKALADYEKIFLKATSVNKNVIFVFGHKHCGWCRVFDRYHADPEIKRILDPEYIIHKIDIIKSKAGKRLFNHYNLPGTPVWMIFNPERELLSTGKNQYSQIIGYPFKQAEIDLYLDEIRKTSQNIDESELEILSEKLLDYGNSRKK